MFHFQPMTAASAILSFLGDLPRGTAGTLVLGIALCAISNLLANRAADGERARRLNVDRERQAEIRGQAIMREDLLLSLGRQLTRQ